MICEMMTMKLQTKLFEHQKRAVEKLSKVKVGALYMPTGTGKTRTALELVARRYNAGKVDHILWLCPYSIRTEIRREIERHLDGGDMSMFTIMGIETLSSSIRANVDCLRLVKSKKVYLVVDESNLVKNPKAKRTQNIQRLADHCKFKLILNGTPVSRNEADMFAQWKILDWRILGYRSFWSFAQNHVVWDENIRGRIKEIINVDYLTRRIVPYTYQVKKEECVDLPGKVYRTKYYELTPEQMDLYSYIADVLLFEVDEFKPYTIYRLFSGLQAVISGFYVNPKKEHLETRPFFKDPLENPRIQTIINYIKRLEKDEKSIIFCKYTQEIHDILHVLTNEFGEGVAVPFFGELNARQRQANLDRFKNEARFLITNKTTAGYGLNLQFCNNVIFYNNDWDYATRVQAEDRVYRIGQTERVWITDICAAGTIDERIMRCLARKENMVDMFKRFLEKYKDKKILEGWINGQNLQEQKCS